MPDLISQLSQLLMLKEKGAITESIYEQEKENILVKYQQENSREKNTHKQDDEKQNAGTPNIYTPYIPSGENNLPSSDNTLLVMGYILSFLPILILPIVFTPLGMIVGLINIGQNKEIHGALQLLIAIALGMAGAAIGGWGFGLPRLDLH